MTGEAVIKVFTVTGRRRKRSKPPSKSSKSEEFERFEAFAKELISVPKSEIDKRQKEYERERQARKKRKPPR